MAVVLRSRTTTTTIKDPVPGPIRSPMAARSEWILVGNVALAVVRSKELLLPDDGDAAVPRRTVVVITAAHDPKMPFAASGDQAGLHSLSETNLVNNLLRTLIACVMEGPQAEQLTTGCETARIFHQVIGHF